MTKKTFLSIALLSVILSLTWIILTPILFPSVDAQEAISAPHEGFLAPPFSLQSPDNQVHTLNDYRGQPVLIFFWASWCSICKRTMPELQQVYEIYHPKGFEILAINPTNQNDVNIAISYFESQGYTYTMLLDSEGEVARDYQLHAFPTSVLVGPDGVIVDVIIGAGMNRPYLSSQLETMLSSEDWQP